MTDKEEELQCKLNVLAKVDTLAKRDILSVIPKQSMNGTDMKIKALQALHDTPPLCLFFLLRMFWHKKNINVSIRFDQIHQLSRY